MNTRLDTFCTDFAHSADTLPARACLVCAPSHDPDTRGHIMGNKVPLSIRVSEDTAARLDEYRAALEAAGGYVSKTDAAEAALVAGLDRLMGGDGGDHGAAEVEALRARVDALEASGAEKDKAIADLAAAAADTNARLCTLAAQAQALTAQAQKALEAPEEQGGPVARWRARRAGKSKEK